MSVPPVHPHFLSSFQPLLPPPRSTLFPYTTLFRSGHRPPGPPGGRELRERRGSSRRPARGGRHRARPDPRRAARVSRSEEHTSELQSPYDLVCRLLLEKKKDQYMI